MTTAIALIGARAGSERVPGQERPAARRASAARLRDRDRAAERALRARASSRPTASRSPRSPAGTAPTSRSCVLPSSRPRPRRTSSGSPGRSPQLEETLRPLRDRARDEPVPRARTRCGAGSSSCSRRPRPTRSARSSSSSSTPGRCGRSPRTARTMAPLLDQSHLDVAWHAGQYQALPPVYVQNSALEIAWTRVVTETGTREGRVARAVPHAGATRASTSTTRTTWRARSALVADGRGDACLPSTASRILRDS